MTVEELCEFYPRLYHMAEAASWPSIQTQGLLSTTALLDLYEVPEPERSRLERERRPGFMPISHPGFGTALLRDQLPLSDAGLKRALTDMTPTEWYQLLNGKVFFWVNEARVERLLANCWHRDNVVLVLDTAKVMERYADATTLCPINSGFTRRFPQPRGSDTFRPISDYPFAAWLKKEGIKGCHRRVRRGLPRGGR